METIQKASLALVVCSLLLVAGVANAATLYFFPDRGTANTGQPFSVSVYATSTDKAINAVSATISFPQEKFRVVSLQKTSSIVTYWVQEPSFSNSIGTISFEAVVMNPGYMGPAGKLLIINLEPKTTGEASLRFASGAVLANDGYGTNILTSLGTASFTIGVEVPKEKVSQGTLAAPKISSSTHSNPAKWYSLSNAKFSWLLTQDVTGARLLVGKIPEAVPTVTYIPPISSREVNDFEDGAWYFHVRLQNATGWGNTAHFRFQIDTAKPSHFTLQEQKREDATDPRVVFLVDALDSTSGIDHYEFRIDDKEVEVWKDDGAHVYKISPLDPGNHLLVAKAVDKAGNYLEDSVEFIIEPLVPPTFLDYPYLVQLGEPFLVKGKTYRNAQVTLLLQREESYLGAVVQRGKAEPQSKAATADKNGNFTVSYEEGLKEPGIYKMWGEVADERGAKSGPTEQLTLKVEGPLLLKISSWVSALLAPILLVAVLLFFLGFIIWYAWQKFSSWRKRIRKEVREAEEALHKALDSLGKGKTSKQLKQDLDDAEKLVKKEIKDIEREVR